MPPSGPPPSTARPAAAPSRSTSWTSILAWRIEVAQRAARQAGYRRYRVGDYRILCELRDDELLVLVIEVGHRRSIYRRG
ncbi:MAG: type II toxin-antitoxin system RelE/ParE family toxin [Defluviicoccus sp.]|nr:type II toxin-antitoxin system RelE/ParE family toxin [Defluviicoccus sp.]